MNDTPQTSERIERAISSEQFAERYDETTGDEVLERLNESFGGQGQ